MNDKFKLTNVLRDITMAQTFDDQAWQHQSQLEQQRYEEEETFGEVDETS